MFDKIKHPFQPRKKTPSITPMAAGAVGAVAGAAIATYLSKSENREKLNNTFHHVKTKAQNTFNALTTKAENKKNQIQTKAENTIKKNTNTNKKIAV